jgi:hypothetical protein
VVQSEQTLAGGLGDVMCQQLHDGEHSQATVLQLLCVRVNELKLYYFF